MSVKLREKKIKGGFISYYLDIYHEGKRAYQTLNIHTKKGSPTYSEDKRLAEQIRDERQSLLHSQQFGIVATKLKRGSFIRYFEEFISTYKRADKRMYKSTLKHLNNFLQETGKRETRFDELNANFIKDFTDYLQHDAGLSGETPQNFYSKLKRIIKRAEIDGLITKNPCTDVKVKRSPNTLKKEVLSIEELRLLNNTECGNEDVKKAFLLACYTGIGNKEARQLKWKHLKNGKLKIKRAKLSKQDKYINNPVKNALYEMLGEPKQQESFVFSLPSDNAINKVLKYWLKRAGINKKITFYCARHTFGMLLLEYTGNTKTVMDGMAHSSLDHTIKYLNHSTKLKDKAIEQLPSL